MDYTKAPLKPASPGPVTSGSAAKAGVEAPGRSSHANSHANGRLPFSPAPTIVTPVPTLGSTSGPHISALSAVARRVASAERIRLALALVITLLYLGLSGVMFALSMGDTSPG